MGNEMDEVWAEPGLVTGNVTSELGLSVERPTAVSSARAGAEVERAAADAQASATAALPRRRLDIGSSSGRVGAISGGSSRPRARKVQSASGGRISRPVAWAVRAPSWYWTST
jgi:hypothetical protein